MDNLANFFRNLFNRICCRSNAANQNLRRSIDSDQLSTNKQSGRSSNSSSVNSRRKRDCRASFLNRLFNNKPRRFMNYRPTKRIKQRTKSKEEDNYLQKSKNDD